MKKTYKDLIIEMENSIEFFYNSQKKILDEMKNVIIKDNTFMDITNVKINKSNKVQFLDYLMYDRKLKESSISNYISSLEKIKIMIEARYETILNFELYEIDDLLWFEAFIAKFESNIDFTQKNQVWHHVLSASYNNYLKFLKHKSNKLNSSNDLYKINLGKKTFVFYNIEARKIGRIPTKSNLKKQGSDNSIYLGLIDNPEIKNIICRIFKIKNIDEFESKKFIMSLNGYKYNILTNINVDGQIQIKVCGDGNIADIFIKYQIFNETNLEQDHSVMLFDFNRMIIDFVEMDSNYDEEN